MPTTDTMTQLANALAIAEDPRTLDAEREIAWERVARLTARSGIDLAVARAHKRKLGGVVEDPEKRRVKVGHPGRTNNEHLMLLFVTIAQANDAKVSISGETVQREGHYRTVHTNYGPEEKWDDGLRHYGSIYANVFGFPSDLDVIERLYTVAVVQMVQAADAALRRQEHRSVGVDGRAYRREFYLGFIGRLDGRLYEAKRAVEREVKAEEGEAEEGTGVALVLADKRKQVDEFYKEENPHFYRADGAPRRGRRWGGPDTRAEDYTGQARRAGQHAATQVSLGDEREVGGHFTNALPSGSEW